jgi:hypothetical protein
MYIFTNTIFPPPHFSLSHFLSLARLESVIFTFIKLPEPDLMIDRTGRLHLGVINISGVLAPFLQQGMRPILVPSISFDKRELIWNTCLAHFDPRSEKLVPYIPTRDNGGNRPSKTLC